jgi:hypothetical protein
MLFCEDCRQKRGWSRSSGYPYTGLVENTKCELCHKIDVCHDVPALFLVPDSKKTPTEKTVDKQIQNEYRKKAESLAIVYVSGRNAGQLDHRQTELLRQIFVKKNSEVDWYATYHLRLKVQKGYQQAEEKKRDKRKYIV